MIFSYGSFFAVRSLFDLEKPRKLIITNLSKEKM